MNPFRDLLSSVDPSIASALAAPVPQRLALGSPKPAPRPVQPAKGSSEAPQLKRKASGPVDGTQNKAQKRDVPTQASQTNNAVRTAPSAPGVKPAASRSAPSTPVSSVPYRGTAALAASRPTIPPSKKPSTGNGPTASAKASTPASKPPTAKPPVTKPAGSTSGASTAPAKKPGGYLAMLQKAKEKDATKSTAAPLKHEAPKILTKKDREQLRMAAKSAATGKKPAAGVVAKSTGGKVDPVKDKRKSVEIGYKGTARPAKKPVEIGYKGTARPSTTTAPVARPGAVASKRKPQSSQSRFNGYAAWSDLDDDDGEEEEEDYESDASSDMEGGIWDLEKEETEALKAAKREDAEALAEENELKRQKEERKRKLLAMSKVAAAKRKF